MTQLGEDGGGNGTGRVGGIGVDDRRSGHIWDELRSVEGRGRDEEGSYLYLSHFNVWGAHDCILIPRYAVESTKRAWGKLTCDDRIRITHDGVPYLDGTATFKDVNPYRTPETER